MRRRLTFSHAPWFLRHTLHHLLPVGLVQLNGVLSVRATDFFISFSQRSKQLSQAEIVSLKAPKAGLCGCVGAGCWVDNWRAVGCDAGDAVLAIALWAGCWFAASIV